MEQKYRIPPASRAAASVWAYGGRLGFSPSSSTIFRSRSTRLPEQVANYINIREQVTLSPSGDSYTGTFTEDVYDPKGNQVDHVVGNVVATRITVDSTFPTAVPNSPSTLPTN